MENISSKKPPFRSGSFGGAKSAYDGVFGGAPRLGPPALSPRTEDYAEIFGYLRRSPRAASMPVLNLPALDAAVVPAPSRGPFLDYREVFGGSGALDIVAFEELMERPKGDSYDSSDEAWTPAQSETMSDESEPFATNAEFHPSSNGIKNFKVSYNKVFRTSEDGVANGVAYVTQLNDVPGYSLSFNEPPNPQKMVVTNNLKHEDFSRVDGKQLKKATSFPNKPFVSVTDISLRTRPSHLPPPSRPPPVLISKDGESDTQSLKMKASRSFAFGETLLDDDSPLFYDVEVDASSSAAVSAAAMKDVMEKAEAKLRSAKHMKERSKQANICAETSESGFGGVQGVADNAKKHGKECRLLQESSYKNEGNVEWKQEEEFYEVVETDDSGNLSDMVDDQRLLAQNVRNHEHGQVKRASQAVAQQKEVNRKMENDNEVHEKIIVEAVEGKGLENIAKVRNKEHGDEKRYENDFDPEENGMRLRGNVERERCDKRLKEATERGKIEERLKETLEREEKEKKEREAWEKRQNERKEKEAREREIDEKRLREAIEKEENERRLSVALEEKEKKKREASEREEKENREKEAREKELEEKRLREAKEKVDNEKRLRLALEEKEKEQRDARERKEIEEREKEVCERAEKEEREKDSREQEVEEKRLRKALEEKEKKQKEIEENEKQEKEARERELDEMRLKEAIEQEEKEKKIKIALEKEENEKSTEEEPGLTLRKEKVKEGYEGEEDTQEVQEVHERKDNEKRSIEAIDNVDVDRLWEEDNGLDESATFFGAANAMDQSSGEAKKIEGSQVGDLSSSDVTGDGLQHKKSKIRVGEAKESFHMHDTVSEFNTKPSKNTSNFAKPNAVNYDLGDRGVNEKEVQVCKDKKEENFTSSREVKGKVQSQNGERKGKNLDDVLTPEKKETEETMNMENERVRKIEEEREREREREKDRMAVDMASLERAAVERANADARQRALADAREKANAEARLRTERAAVERATAEARERAFQKAKADNAAIETREHVERMRQSSLRSDSFQGVESTNGSINAYSSVHSGVEVESAQRCKARFERHQRTAQRAAKALEEKNMRDLLVQKELAERNRLAEGLDAEVKRWSSGKEGNLRALLSTLQYILGPDSGWKPIPLTEVITSAGVKRAYRKATLYVHPDKLQQRGASIHQKYVCEKLFYLLKAAWNKFNSEER